MDKIRIWTIDGSTVLLPKHKLVCPTHSEVKRYQNKLGPKKGLLQGHARRSVVHDLKTPNFPRAISNALLKER